MEMTVNQSNIRKKYKISSMNLLINSILNDDDDDDDDNNNNNHNNNNIQIGFILPTAMFLFFMKFVTWFLHDCCGIIIIIIIIIIIVI